MPVELQQPEKNDNQWWVFAVSFFGQIAGWIALPIIAALFFGRWMDDKYQTEPWWLVGSIAAAFIISNIGIVRETLKYTKQMEEEQAEKKTSQDEIK